MGRFSGKVPVRLGKLASPMSPEMKGGQTARAELQRPALAGNRLESTYAFRAKAGER